MCCAWAAPSGRNPRARRTGSHRNSGPRPAPPRRGPRPPPRVAETWPTWPCRMPSSARWSRTCRSATSLRGVSADASSQQALEASKRPCPPRTWIVFMCGVGYMTYILTFEVGGCGGILASTDGCTDLIREAIKQSSTLAHACGLPLVAWIWNCRCWTVCHSLALPGDLVVHTLVSMFGIRDATAAVPCLFGLRPQHLVLR